MPVFAYAATDKTGKIVRGRYAAESAQLAATAIEKNGYTVTSLEYDNGASEHRAVTIVNTVLMGAICQKADAIRVETGHDGARVVYRFAVEELEQQTMKQQCCRE